MTGPSIPQRIKYCDNNNKDFDIRPNVNNVDNGNFPPKNSVRSGTNNPNTTLK